MPDKAGNVLLLHHTVFQQFRAADDSLKRGFELVGNIRRKFPARLLRRFALGNVKRQQHRAHRRADAADVELPDPAAALHTRFTVAFLHGVLNGKTHIMAAVDGQKVLSDAACICAKKLFRRGVDAQHALLLIKQHKALAHAAGDLREFRLLALQLAHLLVDLPVLAVDAPEQRSKLLVGVVFERVLKVKLIERSHNTAREALRQNAGEDQRHDQHHKNGLYHADKQYARRRAADGNAQHAPI